MSRVYVYKREYTTADGKKGSYTQKVVRKLKEKSPKQKLTYIKNQLMLAPELINEFYDLIIKRMNDIATDGRSPAEPPEIREDNESTERVGGVQENPAESVEEGGKIN